MNQVATSLSVASSKKVMRNTECVMCGKFASSKYILTDTILCKTCKRDCSIDAKTVEEVYLLNSNDTKGLKRRFDKYAEASGTEYQYSKSAILRIALEKFGDCDKLAEKQERKRQKKIIEAKKEKENTKARHDAIMLQHVKEGKLSLHVYEQVLLAQKRLEKEN